MYRNRSNLTAKTFAGVARKKVCSFGGKWNAPCQVATWQGVMAILIPVMIPKKRRKMFRMSKIYLIFLSEMWHIWRISGAGGGLREVSELKEKNHDQDESSKCRRSP